MFYSDLIVVSLGLVAADISIDARMWVILLSGFPSNVSGFLSDTTIAMNYGVSSDLMKAIDNTA
ncbi:MAG TPA: hypothetical protein V6C50_12530 [Crinalium sp.]